MNIVFRLEDDFLPTREDFQKWIKEDGVGADEVYNCDASLEERDGTITWKTVSGYEYRWQQNENGKWWEYEGPERGFLDQALLPPILKVEKTSVQVIEVDGSYGFYDGPDALRKYKEVKRWWERAVLPNYDAFVEFGFIPNSETSTSQRSLWAKMSWQLCRGEVDFPEPSTETARLESLDAVHTSYGHLMRMTDEGVHAGRMTLWQYAAMVNYFQRRSRKPFNRLNHTP